MIQYAGYSYPEAEKRLILWERVSGRRKAFAKQINVWLLPFVGVSHQCNL
jgi:hypothetical protein